MRLLALLLALSFASAEYWTVHVNARLKCHGRTVKDRLHYEVTDANYTHFERSLRTVTRGRTRPLGWIQFTATKRHLWEPTLTIFHRCGAEKLTCHKTVNITVPSKMVSTKFPKSFNLTGDDTYFSLDKPPATVHSGTDCSPYFERKRRH